MDYTTSPEHRRDSYTPQKTSPQHRRGSYTPQKTSRTSPEHRRDSFHSQRSSLAGRITTMGLSDTGGPSRPSRYHSALFEDDDVPNKSDHEFLDDDYESDENDDDIDTLTREQIEKMIKKLIVPLHKNMLDIRKTLNKRPHGSSPTSPSAAHLDKESRTNDNNEEAGPSTPIRKPRKYTRKTTTASTSKPVRTRKGKEPAREPSAEAANEVDLTNDIEESMAEPDNGDPIDGEDEEQSAE